MKNILVIAFLLFILVISLTIVSSVDFRQTSFICDLESANKNIDFAFPSNLIDKNLCFIIDNNFLR